jgi:hypothetical protein
MSCVARRLVFHPLNSNDTNGTNFRLVSRQSSKLPDFCDNTTTAQRENLRDCRWFNSAIVLEVWCMLKYSFFEWSAEDMTGNNLWKGTLSQIKQRFSSNRNSPAKVRSPTCACTKPGGRYCWQIQSMKITVTHETPPKNALEWVFFCEADWATLKPSDLTWTTLSIFQNPNNSHFLLDFELRWKHMATRSVKSWNNGNCREVHRFTGTVEPSPWVFHPIIVNFRRRRGN